MRNSYKWTLLALLLLASIGTISAAISQRNKVKTLNNRIDKVNSELKGLNDTTIKQLKIETTDQQKAIDKLNKDLQSKRQKAAQDSLLAKIVPTVQAAPPPPVSYPTLSTNDYKLYIYNHESGNNPTRWNSSGCLGLGQACPAAKLLVVCPTMDYNCEDNFFTGYANARYGGWQGAYSFWLGHSWW